MRTLQLPLEEGGSRSTAGFTWGRTSELPSEWLETARSRLAAIAGFFAVAALFVLVTLAYGPLPDQFQPRFLVLNRGPLAVLGGTCLAVSVVTGMRWVPLKLILTVGMVFQVFVCGLVSLFMTRGTWVAFDHLPVITWTAPLIILFPLLIPTPPARTLLVAVASAITAPASLLYLVWSEGWRVSGFGYVTVSVSPGMAVLLAMFGTKLLYRISREAATAREMGSYRLEALLGKGGMGEVWRASHRMLARPAAVKLVRAEALGVSTAQAKATLDRFEREAQVTANLKSGHTVGLYDFGRARDGSFYYVMELLDGVDLDNLVRKFGPMPPERVVHVLIQLCHSLDEAHAEGLVHRDIKPANVFACRYGRDYDFVKVLDFGLVKGGLGEGNVSLTAADAVLGTPAFMAPEMVTGDAMDGRADLYAVGCLAYWLLSGQLVFDRKTPMAVVMAHANEPPPRVSELTEGDIPSALESVIETCLAKDPAERPADAAALAEALCRIELPQPWTADRAESWWRCHRPETSWAEVNATGATTQAVS
jgi:serine/threonine-protein kinase